MSEKTGKIPGEPPGRTLGKAPAALPGQRRALGGALLAAGWILRLGGAGVFAWGGLSERSVSTATGPYGLYAGTPWYLYILMFAGVMAAGGVAFLAGMWTARLARRHRVPVLSSADGLPPGSYVLYLRPFRQDSAGAALSAGPQPTVSNPAAFFGWSGRTHEERLARTFREFGPMLAVGRPGEALPTGSGARRAYLPADGEQWKETVGELIDNARVILLGAGPGPGTVWEYVEVMRRRDPSRLVVLVTSPADYERFKAAAVADAEGVLYELKARYGERWQQPVLPDLPVPRNPKAAPGYYFRAMVYFGAGWEPRLAFFDRSTARTGRAARKQYNRTLSTVFEHLAAGTQGTRDTQNAPGTTTARPG